MNILVLEDEKLVIDKINKIIKKIIDTNHKKVIININYLWLLQRKLIDKKWYITFSNKIKLLWFKYILIDRDNEFWDNFHNIFFNILEKNVKKWYIKNFNDIKKIANSIYLISWWHKNNLYFIDIFIKEAIKYWFINNFNQQQEIEKIMKNNIYTKSISYKFDELLNKIR